MSTTPRRGSLIAAALVATSAIVHGCDCGGSTPGPADGSGAGDGGFAVDGAAVDSAVADRGVAADAAGADRAAGDASLADAAAVDSAGVDTAGVDGAAADTDAGCPPYQALCDAGCIPVSLDPANCGGCGVTCSPDQVCTGGGCVDECLPGQTECGSACVDILTDNDNCGDCGDPCPADTGCVEGDCQPTVTLGPPPPCPNGGPPIYEPGIGGVASCTGYTAQVTFRWALCSCDRISVSSSVFTDGYDSRQGPYAPGGLGGGVGLNGRYSSSGDTEVWGTLWGSDPEGFSVSRPVTVMQELHSGGRFGSSSSASVASHAWINGDVDVDDMSIGGTLYVPAAAQVSAGVTYPDIVLGPVTVPPPCDCEPNVLIPVAAIVAARELDNDNAAIGLDPGMLNNPPTPTRLDLPCGRYYLDAITGSRDITIAVHGRAAIYVGAEVSLSGALRIAVDPDAELDFFVAGRFHSSRPYSIGSPAYPALARFYIGGDFSMSSQSLMGAYFYAAQGDVSGSGDVEIFGGLIAGTYTNSAPTTVHYDRGVLWAAESCPPDVFQPDAGIAQPDAGSVDLGVGHDAAQVDAGLGADAAGADAAAADSAGSGDAWVPECSSCLQCGNQACIDGVCAPCTDSAECCAPLVCVGGVCTPWG